MATPSGRSIAGLANAAGFFVVYLLMNGKERVFLYYRF